MSVIWNRTRFAPQRKIDVTIQNRSFRNRNLRFKIENNKGIRKALNIGTVAKEI
jgi:hypothetical protein